MNDEGGGKVGLVCECLDLILSSLLSDFVCFCNMCYEFFVVCFLCCNKVCIKYKIKLCIESVCIYFILILNDGKLICMKMFGVCLWLEIFGL